MESYSRTMIKLEERVYRIGRRRLKFLIIWTKPFATIRPGEEILVLNNDTRPQTVLNGKGSDDPLSGKLFSVGAIKPKAFIEYGAFNLQDGKYPFYLQSDPNVKGELTVVSSAKK